MFTIVVRSRKDAAAVSAMVERFYRDWGVDVKTLHGARSPAAAEAALEEIIEPDKFYIVLLGREDREVASHLAEWLPPNVVLRVVPRARVRNARLEQLYMEVVKARTMFRVATSWDESRRAYVFGPVGSPIDPQLEDPAPSYEVFIGVGRFSRLVSRLSGTLIGENPLVVRTTGGTHIVYNGPNPVVELDIGDAGFKPRASRINDGIEPISVSMDSLVEANREVIGIYERAAIRFLRSLGEFDTIIVPWSGGKDSTAALLLALKAYGKDRVRVVYGDTGTEFPDSVRYVEEVAEKLGIEVVRAYAGIDKELMRGAPLPSHGDRWCTILKVKSIEEMAVKLAEGKTLLVVGDRDAESPRRSARPPVRRAYTGDMLVVTPLRMWSAAHVQLYIIMNGLPLNPMYYYGFYRIGCYMCPALRNWEIYAMTTSELHIKLSKNPIYRRFIVSRLYKRAAVTKTTVACVVGDEAPIAPCG
ncbi:phosphoadenosine phosphosulfate reductase family protein [Hyperthermus butylicus]|uniref:3'-phosphoadenosine 5'-phosphosulfate sulfotransferase n=1 Tax=Hyperthermus butylicus (strain DSM 5456 / JCM 9403 / PLM1-5) TaxID=415426 RepID=A2BJV9_HYPBU|nr:phosphoadenosine phosphosulfate reductase family protein [Hyperthermus butylicus]ABM80270.1 3'-phosphoadenosine 5'-phosphosulfate sulfotransferase [Hyperthermus butylicus DSM 5456]